MPGEELPAGVYRDRRGYRAYVWVEGETFSKRFPRDKETGELPSLVDVTAWQRHTRSDAERKLLPKHKPGSFASDVETIYLPAVRAMPTYKERKSQMALWVAEFGELPRDQITPAMVKAVAARWRTQGPRAVQKWVPNKVTRRKERTFELVPKPLAASTVNHRLRALENYFTVCNGLRGDNPVREVAEFDEDEGEARGLPLAIIEAILAKLPDRGYAPRGKARLDVSKAKARLHVMAWLGLPPAQLELLTSADFDEENKSLYVRRRAKGKGVVGGRVPVTAAGVEALKMLDAADAWGAFDQGVVRRAWKRAVDELRKELEASKDKRAKKVAKLLAHVVPYQLRHSHAAAVLQATGSLDVLQKLLRHGDRRTSERYARSQVPAWLAEAAELVEKVQEKRKVQKAQPPQPPPHSTTGSKKR